MLHMPCEVDYVKGMLECSLSPVVTDAILYLTEAPTNNILIICTPPKKQQGPKK